ncbi:O-FucT domain protein [Ceratobasidium sp. AG-Ba]|nr:O-FucT domain protein [Ceratobasidium sp. AG-Ba]
MILLSRKPKSTAKVVPSPEAVYRPIRVDRLRMEELGMYDEPEWFDAEWMHQPAHANQQSFGHPTSGPLLVTALPETKSPKHKYVPNALADWRLCGRNDRPCQVTLVGTIGEQESKAQSHVQQIAVIARDLNRTLILPNMHKSRFGTCFHNRFDMYYDVGSLQTLGVRVATYEAFLEWAATRRTAPQAQVVEIMAWEQQTAYQSLAWQRCLAKAAPRLKWLKPAARLPVRNSKRFISSGRSVVKILSNGLPKILPSHPNMHDLDVPQIYALDWKLRHPVVSEVVGRYLTYSSKIVRRADDLLDAAGPVAVVHWRMESVPASGLVGCSKGLINTFEWMSQQVEFKDIRSVYLATDYPLENVSTRHSGTFRDVGQQHHAAIDVFRRAFQPGGPLEAYKLVSYLDLVHLVPWVETALEDDLGYLEVLPSVRGIGGRTFYAGRTFNKSLAARSRGRS